MTFLVCGTAAICCRSHCLHCEFLANTSYGGSDPLRESLINASTYLGDSFDAADMFTAEEFLTLGLDPLELDEIQMLSDATLVTDPETEDSFRLDRV